MVARSLWPLLLEAGNMKDFAIIALAVAVFYLWNKKQQQPCNCTTCTGGNNPPLQAGDGIDSPYLLSSHMEAMNRGLNACYTC